MNLSTITTVFDACGSRLGWERGDEISRKLKLQRLKHSKHSVYLKCYLINRVFFLLELKLFLVAARRTGVSETLTTPP